MKKIIFLVFILFVTLVSCNKEAHKKEIVYLVSNSLAGFNASYLDETASIKTSYFTTASANDKVKISTFLADEGDIIYLSVRDTATLSFVKVFIFINGQVYKQASRTNDKTMPVTVSGTVPYDE